MDGYVQTGIGIVVSVFFFLIGYRQTIGARRERVGSANRSVYKALLRRLVLEDYVPKLDDINRLIEGKAQEFKVSPGALNPDEQVLNHVFAEIFDNDFIAPGKRSEIEARVGTAFDQLSKGKQKVDEGQLLSPDIERRRFIFVGALAIIASLMGAAVSLFLIGGRTLDGSGASVLGSLAPVFVAFVASLISVVAISVVKKLREAPDEVLTRVSAATEGAMLEHEVVAILTKLGISFKIEPKLGLLRPDFLVELAEKRIAIETKSWRSPPPLVMISRVVRYLEELIRSGSVHQAIVVTRGRIPASDRLAGNEAIEFVPIKDLAEWLRRQGK